jgi:FAD-dependent monooxygenase
MTTNGIKGIKTADNVETLSSNCVLIAGGGPVGLLLSVVLASYGVKSVLLERNQTTTK